MSLGKAVLIVIVLIAFGIPVSAGEPGTSGFLFLRLGNGSRAGGMGEAFTAVTDDPTAIYFNPASLAAADGVALNVSHSEWLVDIRFEQVSIVSELLGGAFGLHFTGLYYGELERYGPIPSLKPDGTFSPYDMALSAGYGRDIMPNLSAGAAVKLIYEKIDFESATGWAVDIGITHQSMIEGLTFAASILNLGPQATFVTEKFYPPFVLRGGAAYSREEDWLHGRLLLALDVLFPNDNDMKVHMGTEYTYQRLLAVRFGYKSNYNVQGATLGCGIYYRNLRFDYAFMPMEFELGDSHRMSISVFSNGS